MAIVTNRGTSQIQTTSNCRKLNTKCNYTHVNNINNTITEFFLLGLVTVNIDYEDYILSK
jgi:hypothetical protein